VQSSAPADKVRRINRQTVIVNPRRIVGFEWLGDGASPALKFWRLLRGRTARVDASTNTPGASSIVSSVADLNIQRSSRQFNRKLQLPGLRFVHRRA
jgi:hypothetical protein